MKTLTSFLFVLLISFSGLIHAAKVNINTADAETLASELTGIGPGKAEAIIAYREQHGPYRQLEDLVNVKGIGIATVDLNKSRMALE